MSDLPISPELYNRAMAGNREAQFELAEIYMQSENDDHIELAEEWALKAAQLGHVEAMYWLGEGYTAYAKDLLEEDIDNDVTAQKLIWGRSRIKNRNAIPAKGIDHVFLGHTPLENIVTLGNCHFIDTAAVFGHKLTVLNISDFLKDK